MKIEIEWTSLRPVKPVNPLSGRNLVSSREAFARLRGRYSLHAATPPVDALARELGAVSPAVTSARSTLAYSRNCPASDLTNAWVRLHALSLGIHAASRETEADVTLSINSSNSLAGVNHS